MRKRQKTAETPLKVAVLYLRYSSHNQRSESLEAQERACRAYCTEKGIEILEVYRDAAKTGTTSEREAFLKMVADSSNKKFRYVIVHKLDRFSRNKNDSAIYKTILIKNGVSVLSVTENLDGSPESMLMETIYEGMNQFYSANLGREVMKGLKENAYKAKHCGGIPPLGLAVDSEGHYIINEAEAHIVRIIFSMYSSGEGYTAILRHLNGLGYKTRAYKTRAHKEKEARPFGKNSLYSILENEKYVGDFIFNKKLEKDVSGNRNPQWKPKDEWIIVENAIPPIVDRETFSKVQARMEANARMGGRFKAKVIYLLSGLVYCGECGASMSGNTRKCGRNKSRYSSYRCSNRLNHKGCTNKELRKEYLEAYVLNELYNSLFSDCSIKKLADMLTEYNRKKMAESDNDLNRANKALVDVKQKISRIIKLVSESGASIDSVKEELKSLDEERILAEAWVAEANKDRNDAMISEDTIIDLINRSRDFVKEKNIAECRNFIESYIGKVLVYADKVEVQFKIHVPDGDDTVSPLTSEERIKVVQNDYRQAM